MALFQFQLGYYACVHTYIYKYTGGILSCAHLHSCVCANAFVTSKTLTQAVSRILSLKNRTENSRFSILKLLMQCLEF